MKVVFTASAHADLDKILDYTADVWPAQVTPLQRRIRAVLERIAEWPECGREIEQRPGVRVVPLIRYPFRLFYQIEGGKIEVLHIHHAARNEP